MLGAAFALALAFPLLFAPLPFFDVGFRIPAADAWRIMLWGNEAFRSGQTYVSSFCFSKNIWQSKNWNPHLSFRKPFVHFLNLIQDWFEHLLFVDIFSNLLLNTVYSFQFFGMFHQLVGELICKLNTFQLNSKLPRLAHVIQDLLELIFRKPWCMGFFCVTASHGCKFGAETNDWIG